jgi:hypothetical protein
MKNEGIFICGMIVFVSILTILYSIYSQLVIDLFNSLLGNLILLGLVLYLGYIDLKWGIGLASLLIILNQSFRKESVEGFLLRGGGPVVDVSYTGNYGGNGHWSPELVEQFIEYQRTVNPHYLYDISLVQKQANPGEVAYLLKNGYWPWSQDVQTMYKNAMAQSFSVKSDVTISLRDEQKIYNQTVELERLSMNSKEGTFLLNGATISTSRGMPKNRGNVVRCNEGSMEKIVYTGYDSINGSLQSTVTKVKDEELPSLVNGFQFVGSPCNPCVALKDTPDYSCPFSLNTGSGSSISPEWQKLWGLPSSSIEVEDNYSFPFLNEINYEGQ